MLCSSTSRRHAGRKTWAASLVDFNTAYGTNSASCAHDLERAYRAGELAAVADSAIAGLVETWLHLRTELDSLGGTFVMFKLPGHGGVYPMAAADACAKACLALHPSAVKLDIRSTLGYVEAVPRNPATLETGATAAGWRRWAGQPSPLAAGTRYFRLLKARLQEAVAASLFDRYKLDHPGGGGFMAVDRPQAGLCPYDSAHQARWTALMQHFNMGVDTYGSEDGVATSASVAQAVASGGSLAHGVHVCACGYEGKLDAHHWLAQCPHGPPPEVRRTAAAILRSISTEILEQAGETPNKCFAAIDRAACILCERRWEQAVERLAEANDPATEMPAGRGALDAAIEEARAVGLPDTHIAPAAARYRLARTRYNREPLRQPPPLPLPPADPAPQWVEAVLVASGGMPHPGPKAIAAIAAQLIAGDRRDYDGNTNATAAHDIKPESKEARVRRAIDKKLVAFWTTLVPAFNDYQALLKQTRAHHKGTALGVDCTPEPQPSCVRDGVRQADLATIRAEGKQREAAAGGKAPPMARKPFSLSLSDLALRRYRGLLACPPEVEDSDDEESCATRRRETERRELIERRDREEWAHRAQRERAAAARRDARVTVAAGNSARRLALVEADKAAAEATLAAALTAWVQGSRDPPTGLPTQGANHGAVAPGAHPMAAPEPTPQRAVAARAPAGVAHRAHPLGAARGPALAIPAQEQRRRARHDDAKQGRRSAAQARHEAGDGASSAGVCSRAAPRLS